jgi:hypothetical protein
MRPAKEFHLVSILLVLLATSSSHSSPLAPVVLFGVGVVSFIVGFRTYREYRIIADTPQIPIRSVPMGLVHVQGKSTGADPLTSPLTHVPCYYYEVQVEKWVKKDKGEKWETTHTDKAECPFRLEDETGKILVNPHQAEYDVPRTFRGEIGPKSVASRRFLDASLGVPAPTEQYLHAYLTGQFSQARAALKSSPVPGSKLMEKALAVGEKMQALGVSIGEGGIRMDFGLGQSYRFTETCLLAGRACNVLGTCTENPSPADQNDRNLIKKGENEKTFLITTKSEKQIEKSLRLKAILLVVIGAALIVGGAALALHMAHML